MQKTEENPNFNAEAICVSLLDRDQITYNLKSQKLNWVGCRQFRTRVLELRSHYGPNPKNWKYDFFRNNLDHSSLLLKVFINKLSGKDLTQGEVEICHCRMVKAEEIQRAVYAGAHTIEHVRQWTTANTACGTCLGDVQKVIDEIIK